MADRQSKHVEKLPWHLFPVECIEEILKVFAMGAKKYSEDNWRTPPYFKRHEITNSMKRHQAWIEKGHLYDDESRLLHSAHVAWNAVAQLYYDLHGLFDVNTAATEAPSDIEEVKPSEKSFCLGSWQEYIKKVENDWRDRVDAQKRKPTI